jgi:hypothetical protein
MARSRPARGQSVTAARCAVISTFALLLCLVTQGSLRALLAFTWVALTITAMGLEWIARRRLRAAQAAAPPPKRRRRGGRGTAI